MELLTKEGVHREQVWLAAWLAVARASNSTKDEAATSWADACLREFDKRFPQPPQEPRP